MGWFARGELKMKNYRAGSAYVLAALSLLVLMMLGVGMLTAAWGSRFRAIQQKNEVISMLAAEAGYEKAIYWMGQQQDMLSALDQEVVGTSDSLSFPDGNCDYRIQLFTFAGSRPVYRVISEGHSGVFSRTVDVLVLQAISGWDMGMCRVAIGKNKTYPVNFADGEIIDMPLHINDLGDSPDKRDIYIIGSPQFLRAVAMGESRYKDGSGSDKYSSVIGQFDGGIYFDQPDSRVADETTIQTKVDRFSDSTDVNFRFTPVAGAKVESPNAAVQLEFFVDAGVGKVRITNNCTVRGFQQKKDNRTWDFRIKAGKKEEYERYDIYGYHLMPEDAESTGERFTRSIETTYVTQSIGGVESEPGGQIFVDGNVIIGGDKTSQDGDQVVKGKITVVATGNIWIADSVVVDEAHDADGRPSLDNPNILGLIAQGVVKVVDPGMTDEDVGFEGFTPTEPEGFKYVPIGRPDEEEEDEEEEDEEEEDEEEEDEEEEDEEEEDEEEEEEDRHKRHLPDPIVVEAAITVGGGGWGAENVRRGNNGDRKEASGKQDNLVVHGSIVEAMRGVVGLIGKNGDGFNKRYYLDERLLQGILPGDIWLRGKYIPAPAGWHDYRAAN